MIFADKIMAGFRREKRNRKRIDPDKIGVDIVAEQVKKVLATSDQKLILMVRS